MRETETDSDNFIFVLAKKGKKNQCSKLFLLFPLHSHIYESLVDTAAFYCGVWQHGREFILFLHCLVIFN